jgi:hypothetical protein
MGAPEVTQRLLRAVGLVEARVHTEIRAVVEEEEAFRVAVVRLSRSLERQQAVADRFRQLEQQTWDSIGDMDT